jgi:hypothetical protein
VALLLTPEAVRQELSVGERVAERIIAELPIVRLGPRTRRVSVDALREWIEAHQEAPERESV